MTKARKCLFLILGFLLLAACLGLGSYRFFMDHYAPVGENWDEKTSEVIDLSGQPVEDLTQLQAFPGLKQIDLRNTGLTCQEYEMVREWFPDAQILWDIPFQGEYYDMTTESLTLTSLTEEDMAALAYFTGLKTISAEDCPDYKNLHDLRMQRSDLKISYRVPVGEERYSYTVTDLTLPGVLAEELIDTLAFLPNMQEVKLVEPLGPADRIRELVEAYPQVYFSWDLELAGFAVNERTETLDLSGIPMTVEEMDAVLPYLLNLTYVDMSFCGISNEEMDALNRRYENIQIVWTVMLGWNYYIRTDATTFMPGKDEYYPWGDHLYNLRYCTEMYAIDLGHSSISNCDFVAFMPHLKYLILADSTVRDLTPLTGLTELVYLEIFMMNVYDLSPLLTLTALEDLNLAYTSGDPNIIAQMTWLKNVWWVHTEKKMLTPEQQQMLRDANPDCYYDFTSPSSTGGGWRELPNYYAQRDAFGMFYMTG